MYRILIIEDEDDMADQLRQHLRRYAAAHHLDFDVSRLASAFDFVGSKAHWDLVFMDIGLPGISGMEAAQLLRTYDDQTVIIFVTSLSQYAVKGYEVGALDFIVKPVSYPALSARMDRAMRVLARTAGRNLAIPTKTGMRMVALRDIVWVQVRKHDLEYLLADGSHVEVRGVLKEVEAQLGGGSFVRISNSCIVNADHVRSLDRTSVTMEDGEELPISRAKAKEARAAFADYFGGTR